MKITRIIYKGIKFDDFRIYDENGNGCDPYQEFDYEPDAYGSYVCPWCCARYGLYTEVDRTPESVKKEIDLYAEEDPAEYNELICGIEGCWNGIADDAWFDADQVEAIFE